MCSSSFSLKVNGAILFVLAFVVAVSADVSELPSKPIIIDNDTFGNVPYGVNPFGKNANQRPLPKPTGSLIQPAVAAPRAVPQPRSLVLENSVIAPPQSLQPVQQRSVQILPTQEFRPQPSLAPQPQPDLSPRPQVVRAAPQLPSIRAAPQPQLIRAAPHPQLIRAAPQFQPIRTAPQPQPIRTAPPPQQLRALPIVDRSLLSEINAQTLRQDQEINPDGSYQYSFETDNGIVQSQSGSPKVVGDQVAEQVTGSFSYVEGGVPYQVQYVADENGFRATVSKSRISHSNRLSIRIYFHDFLFISRETICQRRRQRHHMFSVSWIIWRNTREINLKLI